jgi:DNA-binding transcriptional MerR regulator
LEAPQHCGAVTRKTRKKAAKKKPATRVSKKPDDASLVKMSELSKRSSVPAPTIKHYIREGLLPGPEIRTSKNMAYYDVRVVGRIRVIKQLQAERFLPLKLIGDLLEPAPSDKIRADRDSAQRRALMQIAPSVGASDGKQRRKRTEVMKTFGVTRAELDSLEGAGVLTLKGEGETAGYGGTDLRLLDILAETRRLGLGELFPVETAELYMNAVRELVKLEIDVFRHRALAVGTPANVVEIARQAIDLGERLIIGLRKKLLPGLLAELARVAPAGQGSDRE